MRRVQSRWPAGLIALAIAACAGKSNDATTPCKPVAEPSARVTFEGRTDDDHYVIVVEEGSATRIFYGTPAHMTEGQIMGTSYSCAVTFDFTVAGASYEAVFAPNSCGNVVRSKLFVGETRLMSLPLTVFITVGVADAKAPVSFTDLNYFCF